VVVMVDIFFAVAALLCGELVRSRTHGGRLLGLFCCQEGGGGRDCKDAIGVGCLILGRFL
jgi:hypothetical protein